MSSIKHLQVVIATKSFRSRPSVTWPALVGVVAGVGLLITSASRIVHAIDVVAAFNSVTLVANPNGWTINGLANTINGNTAGGDHARIFTGLQDATGVVIDYGFVTPQERITRLQLWNNGGAILNDFDGIGTATIEVFDPSNVLLFTGPLNAGNGGAIFETVFPTPLNNVSRVRLSEITNLPGANFPDIIWREFRAMQDLNPAISLDKSVTGPSPLTVGSTLSYSFLVTNSGDATLTGVTVTDPLPGLSPISCPGTTLAPGAGMTCTASYVVIQSDVDNGFVNNTATARGTPPGGLAQVSAQDSATIPATQTRSIDLEKTASTPAANGTVTYSFQVTNTGTVSLTGVAVTDPLPGLSAISCPATTLTQGAAMTCTATYTLTQADMNAGLVTNTATATGTPPSGPAVTDQDSATVSVSAQISLAKTGTGPNPLTLGSMVSYSFLVTNTGQLTLTGLTVTDPLPGLSAINCPATTLAPDASTACTATYVVTQADVSAGRIDNTATATGTPPNGLSPVSAQDDASVPPLVPVPTLPQFVLAVLMILLPAIAVWQLRRNGKAA